jgi:hypothetical protein
VVWFCGPHHNYITGAIDYWYWQFSHIKPKKNDQAKETDVSRSSPPYKMFIQTAVGEGRGGGVAIGQMDLRNPDDTLLTRRIAVRTIMQVEPSPTAGWLTCHDTGWKERSSPGSRFWVSVVQYTQPDCGKGYYRAQVAARFFSISLNRWETRGWVYSPSLYLPAVCCAATTEPAVTPSPAVNSPE